jgi:SAM-dependent methyltransferase
MKMQRPEEKEAYPKEFFEERSRGATRSARQIVPLVLDLLHPQSVIDVGCGIGNWLSVFCENGIEDFLGVDGDYVDLEKILIPADRFLASDLTQPLQLEQRFDLVVSLEVAEHLPADYACTFIKSLTRLGPVVMFSAAIPFQGGSQHLNEQWPDYWAKLFNLFGYSAVDCLRPQIWQNENIDWWYVQNLLLFVNSQHLATKPQLQREAQRTNHARLSLVHPKKWMDANCRFEVAQELPRIKSALATLMPAASSFILVDDDLLRSCLGPDLTVVPFLEKDGRFWGPPADSGYAIQELERLRKAGVTFIVFAWVAFWWLDHYSDFAKYLSEKYRCVLQNERLVVFELKSSCASLSPD